MTEATSGLENKANAGAETMLGEFMTAFEEFKRTNDGRLAELEKRGGVDALTEDKLNRLNGALDNAKSAIDRANLERARPRLEGGRPDAGDEYKDAFAAYVKRGEEKALRIGSNPDGGYLVPSETDGEITRLMAALSPIRAIASVRQVSTAVYKKPVTKTGPEAGWVAETDARPETDSQVIDALSFPTAELYAMPAADGVGTLSEVEIGLGPILPLMPVHLTAMAAVGGDIALSWVRRSRADTDSWAIEEAPLDWSPEAYRLEIYNGVSLVRMIDTAVPSATYSVAQQTADFGAPPSSFGFRVAQKSATYGPGHWAEGEFNA